MVDTSMIFRNTPYIFLSLSPLLVSVTSIDPKDSMLDAAANSLKETKKGGGDDGKKGAAAAKGGGSASSKPAELADAEEMQADMPAVQGEEADDGEEGEEEMPEDDELDVS